MNDDPSHAVARKVFYMTLAVCMAYAAAALVLVA
jgi:hypothetical protein